MKRAPSFWITWISPYDDARAHRGQIRGDFVVMGFSYTPNWAAARNGHDKYDFFVRRSFNGGVTWTTDPDGSGVTHCDTFTDPLSKEKRKFVTPMDQVNLSKCVIFRSYLTINRR